MKLPLRWLDQFIKTDLDTAALCERLTMAGLEVDAVEERGAAVSGVVVGRVVSTERHPDGERLTVCSVDFGGSAPATVVCGAANVRKGIRVAFARAGAELPGDVKIGSTVIRGVESSGMLCSETELGIAGDSSGILALPSRAPVGADVADLLELRDTIVEVSITPNRGDCLSILGLAREVALLTGGRIRQPRTRFIETGAPAAQSVQVRIDDPVGCRRYAARVIRDIRVGPSPLWLRMRLDAAGVRAINNVVDVSNFVMLERGQPLHAFDTSRLRHPRVVVRRAGATPAIQTLDGVVRALEKDDLLVSTGDEPIAIAGVMGGADSEVREDTTEILLESAWFEPSSVRRTARRLDLHSEAAYRFERSIDIEGVPAALDRAAALIAEVAGGHVAPGIVDEYVDRRPPPTIELRPRRVAELLGSAVAAKDVRRTMRALGAAVAPASGGALSVTVPSFRNDLEREIDLIEEVARVAGYDTIPTEMPQERLEAGSIPPRVELERAIRQLLQGAGLSELVGLAFASSHANHWLPGLNVTGRAIKLLNPITQEEPELRLSILNSVVAMWRHNRNQGSTAVAGYSIGKVYWHEDGPAEGWRLGGVMAGEMPAAGLGARRSPELSDVKGVLETIFDFRRVSDSILWESGTGWKSLHPGKSATIHLADEVVGLVGALHPDAEVALDLEGDHWLFELDLDRLSSHATSQVRFRGLPRFPSVLRDLALVVDGDFESDRIVRFVLEWNHDLVEAVELFDEYVGSPIAPGKKSLAYSIAYRADDRTLTDGEVNALQEQLMAALEKKFAVEHRQ